MLLLIYFALKSARHVFALSALSISLSISQENCSNGKFHIVFIFMEVC